MTMPGWSAAGRTEYRVDELRIVGDFPLGEGGSAQVWRCTTPDEVSVAFKRYDRDTVRQLEPEVLRELVDWPHRLDQDDRKRMLELCAWPHAVVVEDRTVVGILMPLAPREFFFESHSGPQPRAFTRVAVRVSDAQKRRHTYFDFPHKIARLGQLLVDLQFLHDNDVVVGDLQPNNILTTDARPVDGIVSAHNYFLDCDSFLISGRGATPRLDPLPWRPPYPVQQFTATTDLFKFALLMIRCLAEDLAANQLDYRQYAQLLPSGDFQKVDRLLTTPYPDLTSADLRALALAWQSVVRPDGRVYRRTDFALREPWNEQTRAAHFAGFAVPTPTNSTPSQRISPIVVVAWIALFIVLLAVVIALA
ncbi:hypothetical protein [Nocardia pseudovaccinii]|uniref:hypothetical protein n=1 Tax=Nocardia pseudovaccinii TaxID=189540 RepID=UPI000A638F7F|nr:hypothetical protein [Nocardia pseudovaccinii]